MTGRSPVAARMTRFTSPLPRDEITFPEILRDEGGYYTGICGRTYHLDGRPGDDEADSARSIEKHHLQTFADRVDFLNTCPDDQVAGQVAAFLDKKPADKPFFMWANFSDPHHPWNAPAEFRPDPASLKLPAHWPDLPGMREQLADYCAEVNRVDRTIAGVLDVLKKQRPARQDAHHLCRRQRPGAAARQRLALRSRLQRAVHHPLARRRSSPAANREPCSAAKTSAPRCWPPRALRRAKK